MKTQIFSLIACLFLFIGCSKPTEAPETAAAPAFDEAQELAAIMATIENETKCFYARDYECWKKNYAQTEYAFQCWSNSDGTFDAKVGWPQVDAGIGKYIKDNPVPVGGSSHPKVERRNMVTKFFGESVCYMVWDQYNINQELTKYTHSKDERIMEKINGEWKIVNVSSFWDYKNLVAVDSLK